MIPISLQLLDADSRNSNVCSAETLEKLQRNIERTGLYPPLIVRPSTNNTERYVILDGHHRKKVLESLGYTSAECIVWSIDDKEAQLALATLNTLRGTENFKKRAELLQSLNQLVPINELAQLIPETSSEIQDLLTFLDEDLEKLEQAIQKQMLEEKETLPVPLTFLISPSKLSEVEEALAHFNPDDRGLALVDLSQFALKNVKAANGSEQ